MIFPLLYFRKTSVAFILVGALAIVGMASGDSGAVTRFSLGGSSKTIPAALDFNEIWFYTADGKKVVPVIDLHRIAVVFRSGAGVSETLTSDPLDKVFIKEQARDLLAQHPDLTDYYYDQNLAEDTCFFNLRPGMTLDELSPLLARINQYENISYAHPTLRIQDRNVAFFNVFTLKWKDSVSDVEKAEILNQVPVFWDNDNHVYLVDLEQNPFFQVLNLLAGDIRVSQAIPYLVEIQDSIQAHLTVDIPGGNLGDRIPFRFRIEFSPRVNIEPSSLATINLRPANIQKELIDLTFDPYDYAKAVQDSPILITGGLKFYTPGDYMIPSVEIKYYCPECSDPKDRTFQTEPVPVRIASIVPKSRQANNLIVPDQQPEMQLPINSVHHAAMINLIISLGCLTLVVAGVIRLVLSGLSLKKQEERLTNEKMEEAVAKKLRLLLNQSPGDDPCTFLSEINTLFRDYLIFRYEISPAPAGGSGLVFWETVQAKLPSGVGLKTKIIFESIDRLAAQEFLDDTAFQRIRQDMEEILDLTKIQA